jgi:hypothetical protein
MALLMVIAHQFPQKLLANFTIASQQFLANMMMAGDLSEVEPLVGASSSPPLVAPHQLMRPLMWARKAYKVDVSTEISGET